MTDTQLIESYKAGDRKALALLMQRYHQKFCDKAYWILKDKDLSKDIAQESWVTIMDKIVTLEKTDAFKYWALRMVTNKSLDALQKINKELLKKNALRFEKSQEQKEGAEEDALVRQKLKTAISRLSAEKQQVVRLFYLQQYPLREIAELLNISTGTVKSRLFKAREELKTTLKK